MPSFRWFCSGELVDFEEAVLGEQGHLDYSVEDSACRYLWSFAGVFDFISPFLKRDYFFTEVYEVADVHSLSP